MIFYKICAFHFVYYTLYALTMRCCIFSIILLSIFVCVFIDSTVIQNAKFKLLPTDTSYKFKH